MKCFSRGSVFCLVAMLAASSVPGCKTLEGDRGRRGARRDRDDGAPKVGDAAPLFGLKMLGDENTTVKLASFRGKRPVVLFFGSYT